MKNENSFLNLKVSVPCGHPHVRMPVGLPVFTQSIFFERSNFNKTGQKRDKNGTCKFRQRQIQQGMLETTPKQKEKKKGVA